MNRRRLFACLIVPSCLLLCLLTACSPAERDYRGGVYSGPVEDGLPEGYGRWHSAGQSYEGHWHAGLYHGWGLWRSGDSTYSGQFSNGRFAGEGRLSVKSLHQTYSGHWREGLRHGAGVLRLGSGVTVSGQWHCDSLQHGSIARPDGIYEGTADSLYRPQGYGEWESADGLMLYRGHWREGRFHGFGFAIGAGNDVRSGSWQSGRYLGETMTYTSDRVYGIDISRYQHRPERWATVRGRRVKVGAPIDWSRLRITHLGAAHNKNAVGDIDFPVSFCYIKGTQGTTIKSAYYAADSRAARAHGIKVGAYHFMSPQPGAAQARWFLRNTKIQPDDMPPVLDVELTDCQIAKMGGRDKLYRECLAWLQAVEQATGKRPILYVSQMFIDRYLSSAPAALQAYRVWIARYGQYRPYVKLLCWQLSPYGGVSGIRGDVDINIFNGNHEQWQRYVDSGYTELP